MVRCQPTGNEKNTKTTGHDSYLSLVEIAFYVVGPCHHGMARPQVADRGTASDKEGSCE